MFLYGIIFSFLIIYSAYFSSSVQITFAASTTTTTTTTSSTTTTTTTITTSTTTTTPGPATGSIQIYKGWNSISFPYADSAGLVGNCNPSILTFYYYDSVTGKWGVYQGKVQPGKGFWAYSDIDCTMQYSGNSQIASIPISQGWNQIGSFSTEKIFSSVIDGCTISQGPVYYNVQTSNWETPTSLKVGNGYWVYSPISCSLS